MSREQPPAEIAVVRTPRAGGAIGVITVDGPQALQRLATAFSGRLSPQDAGRLRYGRLRGASGEALDDVLVAVRAADESETGNWQADVNTHGGPVMVRLGLEALRDRGFTVGDERELWRRSLQARRLDLLDVEERLAGARCLTAAQFAAVSGRAEVLREAARAQAKKPAENVRACLRDWLQAGDALQAALAQRRIVVAGPVNAGKSTLVNRLTGQSRVIVSEAPGTTRDVVAVDISLRGLAVRLMDTAGQRQASGTVERIGQDRAWQAMTEADLVLLVVDAQEPAAPLVEQLRRANIDRFLLVRNKIDRHAPMEPAPAPAVDISAQSGAGIEAAVERMVELLLPDPVPAPDAPATFTRRQHALLTNWRGTLERNAAQGRAVWEDAWSVLIGERQNLDNQLNEILKEADDAQTL